MWAASLSPESRSHVEADVVNNMEGNSAEIETQGIPPGVLIFAPPPGSETGARTQGSPRNLGALVTSGASRNGGAER